MYISSIPNINTASYSRDPSRDDNFPGKSLKSN